MGNASTERRSALLMTKAFTYEVKMTVQILAEDKDTADKQLDEKGGYVSGREVKLLAATDLMPLIKPSPKLKAVPAKEAE